MRIEAGTPSLGTYTPTVGGRVSAKVLATENGKVQLQFPWGEMWVKSDHVFPLGSRLTFMVQKGPRGGFAFSLVKEENVPIKPLAADPLPPGAVDLVNLLAQGISVFSALQEVAKQLPQKDLKSILQALSPGSPQSLQHLGTQAGAAMIIPYALSHGTGIQHMEVPIPWQQEFKRLQTWYHKQKGELYFIVGTNHLGDVGVHIQQNPKAVTLHTTNESAAARLAQAVSATLSTSIPVAVQMVQPKEPFGFSPQIDSVKGWWA